MTDQIERLITGHFDGCLTESEENELVEGLQQSPEFASRFLAFLRLEGHLISAGQDGLLGAADRIASNEGRPQNQLANDDSPSSQIQRNGDSPMAGEYRDGSVPSAFVDRDDQKGSSLRRILFLAGTSLTASVLLVASVLIYFRPPAASAATVLEQAQLAAGEDVDRTYELKLFAEDDDRKEYSAETIALNCRGGGRYVVALSGKYQIAGRNPSGYWFVPRTGPVLITNDLTNLPATLRSDIPSIDVFHAAAGSEENLVLSIAALLKQIQNDYDVKLLTPIGRYQHMQAKLKSGRSKELSPAQIEVWSDSESGVVHHLDLISGRWTAQDSIRRFTLQLVNSDTLDKDWYDYTYHAPSRPVVEIVKTQTNSVTPPETTL